MNSKLVGTKYAPECVDATCATGGYRTTETDTACAALTCDDAFAINEIDSTIQWVNDTLLPNCIKEREAAELEKIAADQKAAEAENARILAEENEKLLAEKAQLEREEAEKNDANRIAAEKAAEDAAAAKAVADAAIKDEELKVAEAEEAARVVEEKVQAEEAAKAVISGDATISIAPTEEEEPPATAAKVSAPVIGVSGSAPVSLSETAVDTSRNTAVYIGAGVVVALAVAAVVAYFIFRKR
jgi:chemotaxis protein histidine kinase CheA